MCCARWNETIAGPRVLKVCIVKSPYLVSEGQIDPTLRRPVDSWPKREHLVALRDSASVARHTSHELHLGLQGNAKLGNPDYLFEFRSNHSSISFSFGDIRV